MEDSYILILRQKLFQQITQLESELNALKSNAGSMQPTLAFLAALLEERRIWQERYKGTLKEKEEILAWYSAKQVLSSTHNKFLGIHEKRLKSRLLESFSAQYYENIRKQQECLVHVSSLTDCIEEIEREHGHGPSAIILKFDLSDELYRSHLRSFNLFVNNSLEKAGNSIFYEPTVLSPINLIGELAE